MHHVLLCLFLYIIELTIYYFYSSPSETSKEEYKTISEKLDKVNLDDTIRSLDEETEVPHKPPSDVPDFDQENWNDPFQVSNYAMDIFNYLKSREVSISISRYNLYYNQSVK